MSFNPSQQSQSVGKFFDEVSNDYDESILRAIPPYVELLEALIQFTMLPPNQPLSILELGCGTGNVSRLLLKTFPAARLTLVDLSGDMLAQAKKKLSPLFASQIDAPGTYLEKGFMDLEFKSEQFDLIVASCSLHHLLDDEKHLLYQRMYHWLRHKGRFVCADAVLSLPLEPAYELNLQRGYQWSRENGAPEEAIVLWQEHAHKFDHYVSLHQHFQWLQEMGFQAIDCHWKNLYWAVFGAEKP